MNKAVIVLVIVNIVLVLACVGLCCCFFRQGKKKQEQSMHKEIRNLTIKLNKFMNYFRIFDNWMMLKEDGISVEKYFLDKGYKDIAVYGMGVMGGHLFEDLKNSSIHIAYGIDKKIEIHYSNLAILKEPDQSRHIDAIVVTATFQYKEIKNELEKIVDCPVISLEEVVLACQ